MATPYTCSYKFPLNWKSWFFGGVLQQLYQIQLRDVKIVVYVKPVDQRSLCNTLDGSIHWNNNNNNNNNKLYLYDCKFATMAAFILEDE